MEWLLVIFALVNLAGLLGYGAILIFERTLAERIYPNISVRGLPILSLIHISEPTRH